MLVKLEAGVWSKVYINGSGWYVDSTKVWLPVGVTISYKAVDANGVSTGWQTKPVECSPLVPECKVHIVLPDDTWVEISGVGWFQNSNWVDIKPVKNYSYRLWNSAKSIAGPWKNKVFAASDCGKDWNLTGESCNLDILLGDFDGWVEIASVGWFQTGDDQTWLPVSATVKYRMWNSAKTIAGPWKEKHIDCTPLEDLESCNLKVILTDPADGWVEIASVGWFQNSDQVWLPVCSTIRYRVWDANKAIATGWIDKHVDCSDLIYPPGEVIEEEFPDK
jgi:hypothetical protein